MKATRAAISAAHVLRSRQFLVLLLVLATATTAANVRTSLEYLARLEGRSRHWSVILRLTHREHGRPPSHRVFARWHRLHAALSGLSGRGRTTSAAGMGAGRGGSKGSAEGRKESSQSAEEAASELVCVSTRKTGEAAEQLWLVYRRSSSSSLLPAASRTVARSASSPPTLTTSDSPNNRRKRSIATASRALLSRSLR